LKLFVKGTRIDKMDESVLSLLRTKPSSFVSGQAISQRLGISRAAVWKRIEALRARGYTIEGVRHSGYRLVRSPDLLTPTEVLPLLKTESMGRVIHYFETLDSTNLTAYQLALGGAKEGEVVIAESQRKGRGRLGRAWYSPAFLNVYLSVILRPPIPLQQAPLMTLVAAVATADAIEGFSGLKPQIKWPNDILIHHRKVAGLLSELHSEADRVHFIILGVGVNLNLQREAMPEELGTNATSLRDEMGEVISRKSFLGSLLFELETWYKLFLRDGGKAIIQAWSERSRIEGKPIRVASFGETLEGIAVGLDSDGALLVKEPGGHLRRVVAGDMEFEARRENHR